MMFEAFSEVPAFPLYANWHLFYALSMLTSSIRVNLVRL